MDDSTAQIFVSYRRDDTGYVARGLGDRLNARFGRVFMDIDDIDPGENFTDVIRLAVAECDVLLALIGKNWVGPVDAQGRRRLDDPDDWIVQEIKTALVRGIWVIPVLVDDAAMPQPSDLPVALKVLSTRHASRIRLESFVDDANRLMDAIGKALSSAEIQTAQRRRSEPAETPVGRAGIEDTHRQWALPSEFHAEPRKGAADPWVTPAEVHLNSSDANDQDTRPTGVTLRPISNTKGARRRTVLIAAGTALVIIASIVLFAVTRSTDADESGAASATTATTTARTATNTGQNTIEAQEPGPHLLAELRTGHQGAISGVEFSPDGALLASAGHDNTVRLSSVADRTTVGGPFVGNSASVNGVAFNSNGDMLATGGDDNTVRLWNVADRQQIGDPLVGHTDHVTAVEFSPDGQTVASASLDGTVRLWDVATRTADGGPLVGHDGFVTGVAFSPDGGTLASAGWDATVRLWDVDTHLPIGGPLTGHSDSVLCVAFGADGKTLATGSRDKTVRLWDVTRRRALGEPLAGHNDGVDAVAFSSDGSTLVSASWDDTVRLWDVAGQQAIGAPLTGHTADVFNVAYSPVAPIVASSSDDGTVRLWDVDQ